MTENTTTLDQMNAMSSPSATTGTVELGHEVASEVTGRALRLLVVGTSIGQIAEWFDWSVYSIFAPYFSREFFPSSALSALLATYLVFAGSFIVRPLGGTVFGYIADRVGRRPAFTASILLMAASGGMIAVLPPYSRIAWAAPTLLIVARLVQSLSAGGEMPSSSALLAEATSARRRGFYSSFIWLGVGVGTLLAMLVGTVMTLLLSPHQLSGWEWRAAFGLGALLCLYGLRLRRTLPEDEEFRGRDQRARRPRTGLRELMRTHPGAVLRATAFTMGGSVSYYTIAAYLPGALKTSAHISATTAFAITAIALVIYIVQMPLWGHLADRIGRRPIMATGPSVWRR